MVGVTEREEGPMTVRRYLDKWTERRTQKGVASASDDDTRIRKHVLPTTVDKQTGQRFGDLVLDDVRPRHVREGAESTTRAARSFPWHVTTARSATSSRA